MNTTLLFGDRLDEMRRKTTAPRSADLWRIFTTRWEGVAARVAENGPFDQGALGHHSMTPMAVEAAAIWRLTGRDDARAYALQRIDDLLVAYAPLLADPPPATPPKVRLFLHSHAEVALAADLLREVLPDATRTAVARLMRTVCIPHTCFEQALAGYGSGGNIPLARNLNAGICALAWGAASGYDTWETVVDNTCDNVRQYLRNGCDADGFSYEGTGYGDQVMQMIFLFCHLLRQARWHDDLLRDEPRLRLQPAAYQHMILPDGSYAATTNDSGHRAPMSLWWLLMAAREWNRPDYMGVWEHYSGPDHPVRPWGDTWPAWTALAQTEPRMIEHVDKTLLLTFFHWEPEAPLQPITASPLPTAICAAGTGTATFRTSWNRDAFFAAILGGGRSTVSHGHSHADCGHIDLALGGEYLAVDTGRYNTNEDQHSVVLIDGANRNPSSAPGKGMCYDRTAGRLGRLQRHPLLDYCVADASEMKSARWALRNFLFIRTGGETGYVVLLDNINVDNGEATHAYWWQLQCATTARIDLTGPTSATVHGTHARIDCDFFQKPEAPLPGLTHTLTVRQDVQEWVWPYGKNFSSSQLAVFERTGESIVSVRRPRLLAVQETGSCMLLSVLSPGRSGEPSRTVRQVPVRNGIGVTVTSADFTDTILVAPDHKLILTDDLHCFSEFAVIRRDTAGCILGIWTESGEPIRFKTV